MRESRPGDTVSQFSIAQERIVGKFCSNCRIHRQVEGGRELRSNPKRTRWVCRWCAEKYDKAQEARND